MVFRLPTHLEPFLPPPSQQLPQSKPWRGTLVVNVRSIERRTQELWATAVETDGDNRVDLWPSHLSVYPTYNRPILNDLMAWVTRHSPPTCTFIPDRVGDPNETTANQNAFRSFSRMLFENQLVAIAPWNAPNRLPGGGVVFYPAQNSTALLIGVIFLSLPFPDLIIASLPSQSPMSAMNPRQPMYPAQAPYETSPRIMDALPHPSSSYRVPQSDAYRYAMSRPTHTQYPNQMASSSSDPRWSVTRGEEDGAFSGADQGQGSQYLM